MTENDTHDERASLPRSQPALPTVEDVLNEYAISARNIYEQRTAGDYTWLGLLWCFTDELDKARAHERACQEGPKT